MKDKEENSKFEKLRALEADKSLNIPAYISAIDSFSVSFNNLYNTTTYLQPQITTSKLRDTATGRTSKVLKLVVITDKHYFQMMYR